ncbi:MAG: hypothetical protein DI537_08745 [Stutzerimonas stutzeri]|nr:MAG: hypothetical protein DI537_08745 [Stutzerimonas stutzeri]
MSAFDDLDALALEAAIGVFGDLCTIYPMKPGPAGINGPRVEDETRDPLDDVPVIRSRWSERLQIGGQGLPTPRGGFTQGASGTAHVATIQLGGLGWRPRQGDELAYADDPDTRFRISEPMADGLSGLHLGLTKV